MATRSSYQQPPYQSTVNEPVVVRPVVITAETGRQNTFDDDEIEIHVKCCMMFGSIGFALIVVWLIVFSNEGNYSRRSMSPAGLTTMLVFGILFSICGCCCFFGLRDTNENVQQSPENTQPLSEPSTQHQMNQGSPTPIYVPVQSASGNMSNVQQPFQYGVHTATGSPQNFGSNKVSKPNSSQICRQWNDGPCSFGEMCRYKHVCIACAESGKMEEKHKASSEECPNEGRSSVNVSERSGPELPNSGNAPSASYYIVNSFSAGGSTFQQGVHTATGSTMYVPVQSFTEIHTATGSAQNSGSNKYNKPDLSQICRQWNEGPCSFAERCRHQHFCIECADSGKMYEKHKASSEECPNKGRSSINVSEQPGAGVPYPGNDPSMSYHVQFINVQQPFQPGSQTASSSPQNIGSNLGNRYKPSNICRQWNDGPCSFGEMCKYQHVCITCANNGKPDEKHKASSEECPKDGSAPQNSVPDYDQQSTFAPPPYSSPEGPNTASAPQNSGPDYDQQPAFAPPPYSSPEGPNTASAPEYSWSNMASNAQYDPPPLFAPPPYAP